MEENIETTANILPLQDLNTNVIINESSILTNSTRPAYSSALAHTRIITYVVVHPILIMVGFFGNSLTIETLRRQRKKPASSYLLVGLAISDVFTLLVKSVFVFYRCAEIFDSDIVRGFPVTSYFLLRLPTTPARVGRTFIVTLAIERVIAVWTPLKVRNTSSRRKSITLVVLLFLLVLLIDVGSMGHLIESELQANRNLHNAYQQALNSMHTTHLVWKYYRLFMAVVFDIMPMAAVIACNCAIVIGLRMSTKKFGLDENPTFRIRMVQEKRITKMLLINSIVFFILTTPHCANQLIMDFKLSNTKRPTEVAIIFALACLCLETANYAINFIVYGVTNASFRRRYLQVLRCGRHRSSGNGQEVLIRMEGTSSSSRTTESDRRSTKSFQNGRQFSDSERKNSFKNRRYSIKPLLCVSAVK